MDSLFPFFDGQAEVEEQTISELPLYKEIAWDFNKDEAVIKNGEVVVLTGNDAIKVWVYHTLKTDRFKHTIYSFDYGQELKIYIGNNNSVDLIKSDIEQEIIDTLTINDYIVGVTNIVFNSIGDTINIDVTVATIYGDVEVENVNV